MKRYCKNVVVDRHLLRSAIGECLTDKWDRHEVAMLFARYASGVNPELVHYMIADGNKNLLDGLIDTMADSMVGEIKNRKISLRPIKYKQKIDGNSGKIREIGVESIKQQILNYAAVIGLMELFDRKIGRYQCAGIPGRGQVSGKDTLLKWLSKNPEKTRYAAKGDIKKCYPSIDLGIVKKLLKKQVKNDDILYLTFTLLDTYRQGLSIGSYLSQWISNYFISFAYHYASECLFKIKKHKNGTSERVRLIFHVLFYADDFVLIGSRKADVKKAMKLVIKFMKNTLALEAKPDWKLFKIDWKKDGKHHGECIDMMGYKIYRDHSEIRRGIFLRSRRCYKRAWKYIHEKKSMPVKLAYRCVSYFGWYKNSDSLYFLKKYKITKLLKYAKRRISDESRICREAAACEMAAT